MVDLMDQCKTTAEREFVELIVLCELDAPTAAARVGWKYTQALAFGRRIFGDARADRQLRASYVLEHKKGVKTLRAPPVMA